MSADFVFLNARVYTMNPNMPWADALAVTNKKISYVGNQQGAKTQVSKITKVLNLNGKMILPGFIDGHCHITTTGALKNGLELTGCKNKQDILSRLKKYIAQNPNQDKYVAFSWTLSMFKGNLITRQEIDQVINHKPVIMINEDSHNVIVNTKALQMAGINKYTPDPTPGIIFYGRENDNTPNGYISEHNAWYPIALATGMFGGIKQLREIGEPLIQYNSRQGITAYQDMGMILPGPDKNAYMGFEMLLQMEREGRLPTRVRGVVHNIEGNTENLEEYLQRTREYTKKYNSELVKVNGGKIWVDGVLPAETALVLEPYESGKNPDSEWKQEIMIQWLSAFHNEKFQFHFHCEANGSVRTALNAIEAVQKKYGHQGLRHVIHHASMIHPDDVPRFAAMGVMLNTTPIWYTNWKSLTYEKDGFIDIVGEKRLRERVSVHRKVMEDGGNLTFGADLPGVDWYEQGPLYMIQAAVTRRSPLLENDPGIEPIAERIYSLEQALRAYTVNGAFQMGMEHEIGSLEVGKFADLIVIEKNLFEVDPMQLHRTSVLMTMMNGEVWHDAALGLGDIEEGAALLAEDAARLETARRWLNA